MSIAEVVWFALAAAATYACVAAVLPWLRRRAIVDLPNERTNHKVPTPRGGGFAVFPVILALVVIGALSGVATAAGTPIAPPQLFIAAAILAALSAIDDLKSLPSGPRFLVQGLAIVLAISALTIDQPVLWSALPLWLDRLILAVGWLWFVNLYNFMDGIDGITGAETLTIALGAGTVWWLGGADVPFLVPVLAGSAAGFLGHNWHPARVFLGDVGSIPVGFLLGALLIGLAASGQLAAALILPAYYLIDSGLTILDRARKREKIWQAHSQHAYQRAVRRGWRHDSVVLMIAGLNAVLVVLAVLSLKWPIVSISLAYLAAAALFFALRTGHYEPSAPAVR